MRLIGCVFILALYLLGVVSPSESLFYSKIKVDIEHSHEGGGSHHHHDFEEHEESDLIVDHHESDEAHNEDSGESSHHHHNVLVFVSNVYISNITPVSIFPAVPRVEGDYQKVQADTLPTSLDLDSIFRPPIV